ncbi:MAG: hypothetical protein Q8Q09_25025 [Deltaproteobacteria bacterium]|nr:hypothetical protein [Deltaproteobacteria bacterium]
MNDTLASPGPADNASAPHPGSLETTKVRSAILLAIASMCLVSAEVLLTRLLSAVTWYGQAFFVLSLAMVGLAAGSLDADRAIRKGHGIDGFVSSRLLVGTLGLLLATWTSCVLSVSVGTGSASMFRLLLLALVCTLPLAAVGAAVARLMTESPVSTATLYGIDLGAAALGALLPLVMLGPLSAPAALVLVAGGLAAASVLADRTRRLRGSVVALACAALVGLSVGGRVELEPTYLKGLPRPQAKFLRFERWNALSHVMLTRFVPQPFALWSPSPLAPSITHVAANAYIDGEAGTPLYAGHSIDELRALQLDAVFVAHHLRPQGTACVIGVGGGRDLAAALLAGHDRVLGVEINPSILAMHTAVTDQSSLIADPRIELRVGDGRVVFARSDVNCAVLQASLVDTWAATAAGAFAHAEATLYTREAWAVFLRRVNPQGILTFSRWYDPSAVDETARLLSLSVASLLDRGVRDPSKHIALVASGRVATVMLSPSPLSDEDLARLRSFSARFRFRVLVAPNEGPASPILAAIVAARSQASLAQVGLSRGLDTSAPTDDRPFFFQLLSTRRWLSLSALFSDPRSGGVIAGNMTAARELLTTFGAALLMGLLLLGRPLFRAARGKTLPGRASAAYFAALGFGFMVAEVALVQRMHVVLGHPTWALVVVLAGLLVAMGIGSAISPRVIRTRTHVSVLCVVVATVLTLLAALLIPFAARVAADQQLWERAIVAGLISVLVGLPAGMCFPSGLRFVSRGSGTASALAINGVTGVLGSVCALVISVAYGIPLSFYLAALVYLLAALCGPRSWSPLSADSAT